MRKEKSDLQQLLNDLLRMWWKPFNREKTLHINCFDKCKWLNYKWVNLDGWFMNEETRTLREIVSIDSWLWQFCVENNLIDYSGVRAYWISFAPLEIQNAWEMMNYDNVHRLLWDTASLDEDKLEDFILENVKID